MILNQETTIAPMTITGGSMVEFTKSMKFIVTFLVSILLLGMFTNQKVTYNFLVLVLLSMIIINYTKVNSMIGGLKYNE